MLIISFKTKIKILIDKLVQCSYASSYFILLKSDDGQNDLSTEAQSKIKAIKPPLIRNNSMHIDFSLS